MPDFRTSGTSRLRRVQFSEERRTIYFDSSKPVSIPKNETRHIEIIANNCAPILGTGSWLVDIVEMKRSPYSRLDFLKVKDLDTSNLEDSQDVFQLDEGTLNFAGSDNFYLDGEVAVYNLDYRKEVVIHFTVDEWKTVERVAASYASSIGTLKIDKFKFLIVLKHDQVADVFKLQVAIQYSVGGQTYWDNFNSQNYQFNCIKSIEPICEITQEEERSSLPPLPPESSPQCIPIPSIKIPRLPLCSALARVASLDCRHSKEHIFAIPQYAASWDYTKAYSRLSASQWVAYNGGYCL